MNRGSSNGRTMTTNRITRFNEAPIHESGKFCVDDRAELVETVLQ